MAHSWRDADVVERLDAHTISWVGENQCDAGLNGVDPLNWGLSWLFPNGHDVAIMQVSGRNLTIKNSLLSKQAAVTNRCIYIHQLLVSGWPTLCLQSYLDVSWHRFDKVLEPHLRDSSPCRHDIITQLLQICWLCIPKMLYWIEVWFEIMFQKPLRAESLPRKYSPPYYTAWNIYTRQDGPMPSCCLQQIVTSQQKLEFIRPGSICPIFCWTCVNCSFRFLFPADRNITRCPLLAQLLQASQKSSSAYRGCNNWAFQLQLLYNLLRESWTFPSDINKAFYPRELLLHAIVIFDIFCEQTLKQVYLMKWLLSVFYILLFA